MQGWGTFDYDPYLTVIRSWWIDDCIYHNDSLNNTDNRTLIVYIDDEYDDCFENDFNDIIDAPVILPIYDMWTVPSQACMQIGGIITDIVHDSENERYIFTLDLDQSPLIYLNHADFHVKKFAKVDITPSNLGETREDTRRLVDQFNLYRRRRRRLEDGDVDPYVMLELFC